MSEDMRVVFRGEFDTADIKKGAKETDNVLKGLADKAKALGIGYIIKKSFDLASKAIKNCVGAFSEAQVAVTKFNTIAKTIGFSNQQISRLRDYAGEVQNLTGMSDEAILGAEQLLLATNALDEEGIKKATLSCADLAVAMGTDITSSAQALAIALQSPTDGLTRLRRSGILFTDEEENLVKALDEAGEKAKAQELILAKIESRYRGVAKAVGDTNVGTLSKISETWGDIKENLGQAILDSIEPSLILLLDYLNQIKGWSQGFADNASKTNTISKINATYNNEIDWTGDDYIRMARDTMLALAKYTDDELQTYIDNVEEGYSRNVKAILEARTAIRDSLSENGFMTRDTKSILESFGFTWDSIDEAKDIVENILGMVVNEVEDAIDDIDGDSPYSPLVPSADDLLIIQQAKDDIDSILNSLGSKSIGYQKSSLQETIDSVAQSIKDAEGLGLWDKVEWLKEIEKELKNEQKSLEPTALEQLMKTFSEMEGGEWASVGFNAFAEGIDALGQALAGNEDAWGDWAKSVLNSISSVIMSHGYEMLAEGTLKLFNPETVSVGIAEVAKSAGIIALGGLVKGLGSRFERGGIVGGSGITGDRHMIFANAGELILNRTQQRMIASQLTGRNTSVIDINFNGTVLGDQESVGTWVYDGIQRAKANGMLT